MAPDCTRGLTPSRWALSRRQVSQLRSSRYPVTAKKRRDRKGREEKGREGNKTACSSRTICHDLHTYGRTSILFACAPGLSGKMQRNSLAAAIAVGGDAEEAVLVAAVVENARCLAGIGRRGRRDGGAGRRRALVIITAALLLLLLIPSDGAWDGHEADENEEAGRDDNVEMGQHGDNGRQRLIGEGSRALTCIATANWPALWRRRKIRESDGKKEDRKKKARSRQTIRSHLIYMELRRCIAASPHRRILRTAYYVLRAASRITD